MDTFIDLFETYTTFQTSEYMVMNRQNAGGSHFFGLLCTCMYVHMYVCIYSRSKVFVKYHRAALYRILKLKVLTDE